MARPLNTEFGALRRAALEKRDKTIAIARGEYDATLVQIAELEKGLTGCAVVAKRRVSDALKVVIPNDRPFTIPELMALLEAHDGTRPWSSNAVSSRITRLRERGLIERIKRATMSEPARYVCKGLEVERDGLGDMTMREAVELVLTRPMTTAEIAVGILEAGWHSTMNKRRLTQYISQTLRLVYKKSGGKWLPKG
jgi:hypothetical protein